VKDDRPLDLWGGLLFVPAVAGALLAISNGKTWGWDPRFWSLLAGSLAVFAVWVRHELRHPYPLIDVRLLAKRDVALPNFTQALCALGAFQFSQLVLLLMQQPKWTGVGLGLSATLAGLFKLPGNFVAAGVSPLAGWACGKWGAAPLIVVGMMATTLGCLAVIAFPQSPPVIVGVTLLVSLGTATVYVAVPNILVSVAPLGRVSETIGMYSVIRSLALAIGAQVMIVLLASSTVSDASKGRAVFPSLDAYQLTLGVMAAVSFCCVLSALLLPKGKTLTQVSAQPQEA
jgi:MFS family permease